MSCFTLCYNNLTHCSSITADKRTFYMKDQYKATMGELVIPISAIAAAIRLKMDAVPGSLTTGGYGQYH